MVRNALVTTLQLSPTLYNLSMTQSLESEASDAELVLWLEIREVILMIIWLYKDEFLTS
jgi:hypothetical protein